MYAGSKCIEVVQMLKQYRMLAHQGRNHEIVVKYKEMFLLRKSATDNAKATNFSGSFADCSVG